MIYILELILVNIYLLLSSYLSGIFIREKLYPNLTITRSIVMGFIFFVFAIPLIGVVLFSFQMIAYLHLFFTISLLVYLILRKKIIIPTQIEIKSLATILLAGTFIFFYPAIYKMKMGTFTEGGGDITIYQNLASHIPKDSVTAGNDGSFLALYLEKIYEHLQKDESDPKKSFWSNTYQKISDAKNDYEKTLGQEGSVDLVLGSKYNPPFFWEQERWHHVFMGINNLTGWILPQGYLHHIFYFVPIGIIYFSILSFIYFLYLSLIADFVWVNTKSKTKTLTILFLFVCSHAFIYPAYNHYYPAWITGLLFLFSILLFIEKEDLQTRFHNLEINILLSFVVLAFYWPFWIFFLISIFFYLLFVDSKVDRVKSVFCDRFLFKMGFLFAAAPLIWNGLGKVVPVLIGFFISDSSVFAIEYMGKSEAFFTQKILLSMLGFFQLGNIGPYSSEYLSTIKNLQITGYIGILSVLVIMGILFFSLRKWIDIKKILLLFCVYLISLLSSQGSLYNQYKALSYGLVLIYSAFSIGLILPKKKYLDTILISLLILFSLSLLSYRIAIMQSILGEKNRESFLSYTEFKEVIDESNPDLVYIIEPYKVSSLYLLDPMIGNVKHLYAREIFYYSQIKTSYAEMIQYFESKNFVYLKKEKGVWIRTTLQQKLEKEGLVYLAPAYFENDKLLIEGEIFFLPNKNLNITVKPQDCQIPKLKLWNPSDKKYIPVIHSSENKQLCEFQFSIPASYYLNSVLIEGRNFVRVNSL
jgi:hypothetical protein